MSCVLLPSYQPSCIIIILSSASLCLLSNLIGILPIRPPRQHSEIPYQGLTQHNHSTHLTPNTSLIPTLQPQPTTTMAGFTDAPFPPDQPPRKRIMKNHLVAFLGELVGTFLFLFISFAGTQTAFRGSSTQAAANPNAAGNPSSAPNLETSAGPQLQQLLYVSLSFGFALAVNVWVFFRISGGLFNPAVSGFSPQICGKIGNAGRWNREGVRRRGEGWKRREG